MGKNKIVIGTRASVLALKQTEIVAHKITELFPNIEIEIKEIITSGDKKQDTSVFSESLKDMFIKELEEELLGGTIDMAVHSLKDMPTALHPDLAITAIVEREDPRDVLISREGQSFDELSHGSVIGTSSLRRKLQLEALRPDLLCREIRGNIHTRIRKLDEGYDAIVLAAAGVHRCELNDKISSYFAVEQIMPAPGQAAICIESCKKSPDINTVIAKLHHQPSADAVTAERLFSHYFGGGCKEPVGAYATINGKSITLRGMLYINNELHFESIESDNNPERAAELLIKKFKERLV